MAPHKKKKKPIRNTARGFATVSTPSKRVGENPTEANSNPETLSFDDEPVNAEEQGKCREDLKYGPSDIQHMAPEELEQHLQEVELQSLLDLHGQRSKKDVSRQIARLEAERRSLRQSGIVLETQGWLNHVLEEILELARCSLADSKTVKTVGEPPNGTDLCVKLWTVQQTLESLHFPNVEGALKHLVKMAPMIPTPPPNALIWGLDEALSWLALYSDSEQLPAYRRSPRRTPPSSRPPSPASIIANGEYIDDDADPDASSSTPVRHAINEASSSSLNAVISDESDDNDPEQLIDKYLSAKYDLLKNLLSRKGGLQEGYASDGLTNRLQRRIQRIEGDILFDREEAMAQWNQLKKDLEAEYARLNTLAMRQNREASTQAAAVNGAADSECETYKPSTKNDVTEDDFFGGIFALNENHDQDNRAAPAVTITVRDFGPLGAGVNPRKVLEDVCRARDSSSKVTLRKISATVGQYRHCARITWSKDQGLGLSPSHLPAQLSFDFQPRSTAASMVSVATTSPQQSEGYLCTLMLFIVCQSTKDEKVYLRLQTVWRDIWKELLEAKQDAVDRADRDLLKQIQTMIVEERGKHTADLDDQTKQKAPDPGLSGRSKLSADKKIEYDSESLMSLWEKKASTVGYQTLLKARQQLPIWEHRQQIIDTVAAHRVTILCAETGAGKSTQVPSFILESHLKAGNDCRILITQPRRISAISLARRVSEELGEQKSEIGSRNSFLGFAVRLESKVSPATRITYVTTGVLLRMLETSKDLENLDYVLLDEVHERTMELDLLFIALRRLLQRRQNLKIVLMSATIDARKFSEYFGNAPILQIPGKTFPVEVKYLEDALELTINRDDSVSDPNVVESFEDDTFVRDESERIKSLTVGLERYSLHTRKTLAAYDEYTIDYTLIAELLTAISSNEEHGRKSILIFMPGMAEIRRLHQTIMSNATFTSGWIVHLLHSSFSNEALEEAFKKPPAQHRKIVIATNIAETGITIPDVAVVIDSCREKVMRFDERRQLSKLTDAFISRSSARQRRGRAGRVQKGLCFHLVTRYRHDNLLLEHHVPEMLRLSLQDPILRIKMWNLGNIEQTLDEAFDPPTRRNITRAIQLLKDVKALTDTESLTPLGRQLAKLPLDVWLGKLVLHGLTFACLDATVFIAAMLSTKSPFTDSDRSDNRAFAAKLAFSIGNSDLLLTYNAYCAWRRACCTGDVHAFCKRNFLSHHLLLQIEEQKIQLLVTVNDAGNLLLDEAEKESLRRSRAGGRWREFFMIPHRYTMNSNNEFAVSSVIAMALYPKLLQRERQGWRNVANNQRVNLSQTSINYINPSPAATWLSFYQTMQTKRNHPTVFETSLVPEAAIVILLGEAEYNIYAGVITLDSGKIRFNVRDWKTMIALKVLRTKIEEAFSRSFRNPGLSLSPTDAKWLNIWQQIVASRKVSDG